jgi:hypothetical protein
MHPQRFMRMLTSTDPRRTDDTARAICSATHARNTTKQTACMLCSQETCPSRPQAWDLAQGLAAARSQKSAQHGTRSARTMQGVCMGREGAHLLPLDADVEVRAVRMQRVWRPSAAGLTTCGAHRAASGAIMPALSGRSGPSSSKHAKQRSQTARRRPAEGRRAWRAGSERWVGSRATSALKPASVSEASNAVRTDWTARQRA